MTAIAPPTIDFNLFDTIVGVVGGSLATIAVGILFGYFLIKYGIVHFGSSTAIINHELCTVCQAEHERSEENKAKIGDLYTKYGEHDRMLATFQADMGTVKSGIDRILSHLER